MHRRALQSQRLGREPSPPPHLLILNLIRHSSPLPSPIASPLASPDPRGYETVAFVMW
ncbi:BQ5605_C002g01641 [Microbotryum silenes-dioicae]|uniref:BQ5605_C002g01641 protein n=1 Tax=Microbotryum silenes-dioicae TaxID=796604 RepID=A0A2X0M3F0_9BASI|nr:BQ5605_C002g01641 [Microbotryum silenes-dioicae]